MIGIELPTLNTNDSSYTLVEWLVPDGGSIEGEEPLAVVETSKASEEIESTGPGILHVLVGGGQECRPGQTIAYLFESAEERDSYRASAATPAAASAPRRGAEHHQRGPCARRPPRRVRGRAARSRAHGRPYGRCRGPGAAGRVGARLPRAPTVQTAADGGGGGDRVDADRSGRGRLRQGRRRTGGGTGPAAVRAHRQFRLAARPADQGGGAPARGTS
ncbi:lipoyl domain-containing protein [Streptomyces violaceoruber]